MTVRLSRAALPAEGRRLQVSLRSPAAVNPAAVQRYRAEMTMPATVTTRFRISAATCHGHMRRVRVGFFASVDT
jgi:hypothetical protein